MKEKGNQRSRGGCKQNGPSGMAGTHGNGGGTNKGPCRTSAHERGDGGTWHEDEAMGHMGTRWGDACLFYIADVCMERIALGLVGAPPLEQAQRPVKSYGDTSGLNELG